MAKKYIDAELLRKEIERQRQFIEELFTEGDNSFYDGQDDAYYYILAFLGTLPEQPASEGLDFGTFAKEMQAVFALPATETKNTENEPLNWEYAIARHFAEWGRKQVLQEIYEGRVKPVDKITAAWLDDKQNT